MNTKDVIKRWIAQTHNQKKELEAHGGGRDNFGRWRIQYYNDAIYSYGHFCLGRRMEDCVLLNKNETTQTSSGQLLYIIKEAERSGYEVFWVSDPKQEPSQPDVEKLAHDIKGRLDTALRCVSSLWRFEWWTGITTNIWSDHSIYNLKCAIHLREHARRFCGHFGLDNPPINELEPLFDAAIAHREVLKAGGKGRLRQLRKELVLPDKCPLAQIAPIATAEGDLMIKTIKSGPLREQYGNRRQ